jgi:hypothetical protein
MITALAPLSTKALALLSILGEGMLVFFVLLIGAVIPWIGRPISTKRYIAICGLCAAVCVLVATAFAIRG